MNTLKERLLNLKREDSFENLQSYLPQDRAQELYAMRGIDGQVPLGFKHRSDVGKMPPNPKGMTQAEFDAVMRFWNTKPGWWCFMNAFMCFVRGNDES